MVLNLDVPHRKSGQVLRNQFLIAEADGFEVGDHGVDREEFLEHLTRNHPEFGEAVKQSHPDLCEAYEASCRRGRKIRQTFVKHLERTLEPKKNYGIDIEWRQTQRECIEGLIRAYKYGYQRPAFEVPTGVGKSMIFGALTRAYLDTIDELVQVPGFEDLEGETEIYLFTSRIALTEQFVKSKVEEVIEEPTEDEAEDKPINMGDIRRWVEGALESPDAQIRVLAGKKGARKSEKGKDSRVTISTYQGLREDRIQEVFTHKKFPLVLCDEGHRVTGRIQMMLDESFLKGGMRCAGSATLVGPQRPIWDIWERITLPAEDSPERPELLDGTAYHASYQESVLRGEAPPLRYLEMKSRIDLSGAKGKTKKDLNQNSVDEILSMNINALKDFIRELFLGDHESLDITGAKEVLERSWLIFVGRVAMAEELARFVNEDIQHEIIAKTGKPFKAAYVDGKMSQQAYDDVIRDFEEGRIQVIFTCEKIGEGVDLKGVGGVASLRPYGYNSEWKLKQEIGRGRINPDSPDDDLLVVDGMFHSKRHQLASILGILGRHRTISGGLLVANLSRMNAEHRLYALIQKGMTWEEIWHALTVEERRLLPYVGQAKNDKPGETPQPAAMDTSPLKATIVEEVERADIALNLSEQSPHHALEYVRLLLRRRYETNEKFANAMGNHTLAKLFKQSQFEGVGTGIDLVNMVLGREGKRKLTVVGGSHMNEFLEKVGNIYEVPVREYLPEGAMREAQIFFAAHFGKVPIPGSNSKTNYKQTYHVGQVDITLQGQNFFTPPINAATAEIAKGWALIELQKLVEKAMPSHTTQYGSRVVKSPFGANYAGALDSICTVMALPDQVRYVEDHTGGKFRCIAIFPTDPEIEGPAMTGKQKKIAKREATKALWDMLLGNEVKGTDGADEEAPEIVNHKGALIEYCQKNRLPKAEFIEVDSENGHCRYAKIKLHGGVVIESKPQTSKQVTQAEHLAAEDLLAKLKERDGMESVDGSKNNIHKPKDLPPKNPTSHVYNLIKARLGMDNGAGLPDDNKPAYQYRKVMIGVREYHECVAVWEGLVSEPHYSTRKATAKQWAEVDLITMLENAESEPTAMESAFAAAGGK